MKQYTDKGLVEFVNLMDMVRAEHFRQIEKWGMQTHSSFEWLTYTAEELGSLAKAIGEYEYRGGDRQKVIDEAIQVATLSLKIAEMFLTQEDLYGMGFRERGWAKDPGGSTDASRGSGDNRSGKKSD